MITKITVVLIPSPKSALIIWKTVFRKHGSQSGKNHGNGGVDNPGLHSLTGLMGCIIKTCRYIRIEQLVFRNSLC
jgi:hypothetical protein